MAGQDKHKQRNALLTASLVVLTAAIFLVAGMKEPVSSVRVDENLFRLADYTKVDSIVMRADDEQVILHYNGRSWMVNDAYPADRNLVDVLFATLQQAVPKRPVSAGIRDSVAREMERQGVDVQIFEDGKRRQQFTAWGNRAQTEAYFKNDNEDPYVMVIPGYRVYVTGILSLPPSEWRDRYVFGFNWRNFKKLEASFPGKENAGFTVTMGMQGPVVDGMPEADTARVNTFLDDISLLTATRFGAAGHRPLFEGTPAMRIKVTDVADRPYELIVFPPSPESQTAAGIVNQVDSALFDRRQIEQVLRPADYFRPR